MVDAAATHDGPSGRTSIFVVNRSLTETTELTVELPGLTGNTKGSATTLSDDVYAANTLADPERVAPHTNESLTFSDGYATIALPPVSWTVITHTPAARASGPHPRSQADAVVRLVPAQFVGEGAVCGVLVDHEEFGADHRREVGQFLDTEGGGEHGVVRAAGLEPAFGCGGQVGVRFPDRASDREPWQGFVGFDDVDDVADQAEAVAEVTDTEDDSGTGGGVEDQADRVFAVADAEWVDLDPRSAGGDRRADLEHVGAEDLRGAAGPRW